MKMSRFLRNIWQKFQPDTETGEMYTYADAWQTTRTPTMNNLIREYRHVAYTCANINAQALASTTFRLFTSSRTTAFTTKAVDAETVVRLKAAPGFRRKIPGEVREVLDHPLLILLENVNEMMDGFALLELTSLYLDFVGVAYWLLESESLMGIPVKLWILPSQLVEAKYNDADELTHYEYGKNKKNIDPEKIVRFSLSSLRDPYGVGVGPAKAAYQMIDLLNKDISWATALMENRARPDTMISVEGIGRERAKTLERQINRKFRRAGVGGIWVTDGEQLDVKPLTYAPKDLEAQSRFQLTKTLIYNAFGVPIALGEGERINRATLEAAIDQHARLTTTPRLTRFSQRINQRLVPRFGDGLFFWFDSPIPKDEKTKAQVRQIDLACGHKVINETRVEDGLDSKPWGEKPWLSTSQQQPSDSRDLNERSRPEPKPVPKDIWSEIVKGLLAIRAMEKPPQSTTPKIKGHNRTLPKGTQIKEAIVPVFRRQRVAVTSQLRSKAVQKGWLSRVDLQQWNKTLAKASYPAFEMIADKSAGGVRFHLGLSDDPAFQVTNPKIRQALQDANMAFCAATNESTEIELNEAIQQLKDDLAEGILEGANVPRELQRVVEHVFTKLETSRADRIAVTEASRAVHLAQVEVAKASGVVEGFEWLLSDDACEICQRIKSENPDGISLRGNFGRVSGHPVYGVVKYPPAHPHCMCTIIEKLKEPSKGVQSVQEKELIE